MLIVFFINIQQFFNVVKIFSIMNIDDGIKLKFTGF